MYVVGVAVMNPIVGCDKVAKFFGVSHSIRQKILDMTVTLLHNVTLYCDLITSFFSPPVYQPLTICFLSNKS